MTNPEMKALTVNTEDTPGNKNTAQVILKTRPEMTALTVILKTRPEMKTLRR